MSDLLALPGISSATQAHGAPEGIVAHQLAHIFFIVSMGVLIYWLRERNLVVEKAWRYIQYSALFFILWNLDTIFAHLFDEQLRLIRVTRIGLWDIQIDTGNGSRGLAWLYYLPQAGPPSVRAGAGLSVDRVAAPGEVGRNGTRRPGGEMTVTFFPIWIVDMLGAVLMIVFSLLCLQLCQASQTDEMRTMSSGPICCGCATG